MANNELFSRSIDTEVGIVSLRSIDSDTTALMCSIADTDGCRNLFKISLELLDTDYWRDMSLGIYDSESAEAGEVVHQMHFNNRVKRIPLPYGLIAMSDAINDPDVTDGDWYYTGPKENLDLVYNPVVWKAAASLITKYTAKEFRVSSSVHNIYFAYLGLAEADGEDGEDELASFERPLIDVFKRADFAVFRCKHGLTASERSFVAVYCNHNDSRSIKKREQWRAWREQAVEFPATVRRTPYWPY